MLICAHLASFVPQYWYFWLPALLAYIWASFIFIPALWREHKDRVYRTAWYDNSKKGWLEKLDWEDVKKLMTNDPLEYESDSRSGSRKQVIIIVGFCMLWLLGIEGMWLLALHFHPKQIEATVHLIGALGLAGAVAKAIYEWRLKARTENRQKWIPQTTSVPIKLHPIVRKRNRDSF